MARHRLDSGPVKSQNKVSNAVNDKIHTILKAKINLCFQEKKSCSWNFLYYDSQQALCVVRDNILILTLPTRTAGSLKGLFLNMRFNVTTAEHSIIQESPELPAECGPGVWLSEDQTVVVDRQCFRLSSALQIVWHSVTILSHSNPVGRNWTIERHIWLPQGLVSETGICSLSRPFPGVWKALNLACVALWGEPSWTQSLVPRVVLRPAAQVWLWSPVD